MYTTWQYQPNGTNLEIVTGKVGTGLKSLTTATTVKAPATPIPAARKRALPH